MDNQIALGSDHAGFELKERIKEILQSLDISFADLGTHSTQSCDYPDFAQVVARSVSTGVCQRGILCCGTGIGMSIAANKIHGIRAAVCHDPETARLSRQHNDANVLCLGARITSPGTSMDIIKIWLSTNFEGGRHERRVEKIESI